MENSNWVELPIKDVAVKLTSGGTPSTKKSEYYENGDIPWLNTKEVDYNRITSTEKYITEEGLKNSSAKWIEENSVIVAMYGATAAKTAITKIPLTTNQACCNIIVNHEVCDYEFLFYNISNKYSELENIAVGAAQQNLSVGVIGNFILKFPPLPEQKAIASVLSSLDDKIDLLHQQNQTLEALAETLFRQWFIERCPEPVEGEAKEDWEDCTIGDLAIHSKLSVHPNRNPDTLYHHYSIPAFDANKKPVVELGKEIQSNKYKVEENSILFSKLNPHKDKRVWLIQDNVEEHAICSTELQVVKPKDKDYLYFIYGWLTNSIYYNEIASGVGGTSGSHQRIEPKAIFTAPCVKIEKDIILQYNSHAEPLFKKQFENQQQIQTLTQLRDTLLPKLMSGEVRVKF